MIKCTLLLLALLVTACTSDAPPDAPAEDPSSPAEASSTEPSGAAGYTFDRPDGTFELADELKEISGLTVLADGRLGAIQDEEGTLYLLDPASGTIEARQSFGEAGDYEGIERAGDRLFVLRSDGTLIELTQAADGTSVVETFDTVLKEKNDTEGLGYDAANGRLLVVAKEDPGSGLDEDDHKAIYAFDLAQGILSDEPAFVLDLDAVEARLPDRKSFKPSALAIHPRTGDVYLLASTTRAIAILGSDGGLRDVIGLPEAMFEQPEGLAFLEDGTLFISSEGDDDPPMLYRYRPSVAE